MNQSGKDSGSPTQTQQYPLTTDLLLLLENELSVIHPSHPNQLSYKGTGIVWVFDGYVKIWPDNRDFFLMATVYTGSAAKVAKRIVALEEKALEEIGKGSLFHQLHEWKWTES